MTGRRLGCDLSGPSEASEPWEAFDDELVKNEKEAKAEIAAGCLTLAAGLFHDCLTCSDAGAARVTTGIAQLSRACALSSSAVQCTANHCTALHCTALHCTALLPRLKRLSLGCQSLTSPEQ